MKDDIWKINCGVRIDRFHPQPSIRLTVQSKDFPCLNLNLPTKSGQTVRFPSLLYWDVRANLFASNFNNQPRNALDVSTVLSCYEFFFNEHQDTESLRIHWSYHLHSESEIHNIDATHALCIYLMSNNYHWMLSSHPFLSTEGRDGDRCFSCMLALCKRGRRQKTVWILNNLSWVP